MTCPHCRSSTGMLREYDHYICIHCGLDSEPIRPGDRRVEWDAREVFGVGGPGDYDDSDAQLALPEIGRTR